MEYTQLSLFQRRQTFESFGAPPPTKTLPAIYLDKQVRLDNNIPPLKHSYSGAYCFFTYLENYDYSIIPIYVGKATHLQTRLWQHWAGTYGTSTVIERWIAHCESNHIPFLPIVAIWREPKYYSQLEIDLIEILNPLLNIQRPGVNHG